MTREELVYTKQFPFIRKELIDMIKNATATKFYVKDYNWVKISNGNDCRPHAEMCSVGIEQEEYMVPWEMLDKEELLSHLQRNFEKIKDGIGGIDCQTKIKWEEPENE